MDAAQCRRRFAAAEHAYLATITPGTDVRAPVPHLVPVTFDLTDEEIVVAVDHKPKRTTRLRRLANIEANPNVAFLVDHYGADWTRLWWVRADARAEVIDDGDRHRAAIDRLCLRYSQYRDQPPSGPAIAAQVLRWRGWSVQ